MKNGETVTLTAGIPNTGGAPNSQHPLSLQKECVVLVEFTEQKKFYPNGEMYECSIEIRIKVVGEFGSETWGATYKPLGYGVNGSIRLSNGFIALPDGLQGRRVGTWVMNEIIKWASKWPNAEVQPIRLMKDHACPENKIRRNRFYEKFGFSVGLNTDEGSSKQGLIVSDLNTLRCPQNIKIMSVDKKIASLISEREKLILKVKSEGEVRKRDLDIFRREQKKRYKLWIGACTFVFFIGLAIGAKAF